VFVETHHLITRAQQPRQATSIDISGWSREMQAQNLSFVTADFVGCTCPFSMNLAPPMTSDCQPSSRKHQACCGQQWFQIERTTRRARRSPKPPFKQMKLT
jgi:hypothetical protein